MPKPRRWEFVGIKGAPLYLEGRILLADRSVAQQADIDSISVKFWFAGGFSSAYTATPSVASTIYDTLQSWEEDEDGYNFRLKIGGSDIGSFGEAYAEVKLVPAGGNEDDDAIICLWQGTIHASKV